MGDPIFAQQVELFFEEVVDGGIKSEGGYTGTGYPKSAIEIETAGTF